MHTTYKSHSSKCQLLTENLWNQLFVCSRLHLCYQEQIPMQPWLSWPCLLCMVTSKLLLFMHVWWCHNSFNILWSSCSTVWGQEGVCFQTKNLLILSGVYKKAIHISLCTIQCAVQWEPIHDPLIYHTPLSRTDPSSICRPCSYTLQIKTYLLFFLPQLQVAVFREQKP